MSNDQDVKMDEAMTDVKQEDGLEPSAVPVGPDLEREKDADKDMVSSEETAVDKGPHHESHDKPHLYMEDKREWIWTAERGWMEVVLQLRLDQERRRLRFVRWRAQEKGRPGRKRRVTQDKETSAAKQDSYDSRSSSYVWKSPEYDAGTETRYKAVKKTIRSKNKWWSKW